MPEFIKKSQRNIRDKWVKRYYFCHVGRSGGRSLVWNYIQAGWDVIRDDIEKPTREEVLQSYASKRGTDRIMPAESFAIVRHPISRLESHTRWALHNKKLDRIKDCPFEFMNHSMENIYDPDLGRQIIPAFDTVFFEATVFQYEIGMRKIADHLVESGFIERWKKNIKIRENSKLRLDWSSCPEHVRDKILKTYEKDFDAFEYDPYEFLKK